MTKEQIQQCIDTLKLVFRKDLNLDWVYEEATLEEILFWLEAANDQIDRCGRFDMLALFDQDFEEVMK